MNAATITHPNHSPIKAPNPKYHISSIVFIPINIPVPINSVTITAIVVTIPPTVYLLFFVANYMCNLILLTFVLDFSHYNF